jgi:hypothetical protein
MSEVAFLEPLDAGKDDDGSGSEGEKAVGEEGKP